MYELLLKIVDSSSRITGTAATNKMVEITRDFLEQVPVFSCFFMHPNLNHQYYAIVIGSSLSLSMASSFLVNNGLR